MATSLENFDVCVPNDKASLYKLSREVRDEVHRYLVKGTYIIAVPPSLTSAARFTATGGVGYDPDGADFSILRVSKTLSQEEIGVLYAKSIFEFYLNFSEDGPCTHYTIRHKSHCSHDEVQVPYIWPQRPLLEPIRPFAPVRPYLENMKDICDSTIDHFTSTDITRHSMQIILRVTRELEDTLSSPLFVAMKRLEGFRTVRVELRSSLPIFERMDPQHANDHLNDGLQSIEAHFEPSLGSATLGYFAGPGDFDYHSYLTFHPHQHLINKLGREEVSRRWRWNFPSSR